MDILVCTVGDLRVRTLLPRDSIFPTWIEVIITIVIIMKIMTPKAKESFELRECFIVSSLINCSFPFSKVKHYIQVNQW